MHRVSLRHEVDLEGWRTQARGLVASDVRPHEVEWWVGGAGNLFGPSRWMPDRESHFAVPRAFMALAEEVVQHRDPTRFALLYRLLWRLTKGGERHLLQVAIDRDVRGAEVMRKAVHRCSHKMTAFVRFREVALPDGAHFVAWFEPEHHVLEATAPFFVKRFAGMRWSILTPGRSAHWDGEHLDFRPGATKADVPTEDALEDHWRAYFASIFNPARLKVASMKGHMPQKYWKNLPEAELIKPLIEGAVRRTQTMLDAPASEPRRQSRSGDAAS